MTSISSVSSSPFSQVQSALSRDTSISATDQTALTSALSDIASQIKPGTPSNASSASGSGKPGSMKEKVESLIDNEVSNGKLTSDQATELKKAFEDAHAQMKGHHGGHGGPHGAGGPPPADGTSDDSTTASTKTDASSTTQAATDPLDAFMKQLKTALDSNGSYDGSGKSSSSSSATSLFVDTVA